MVFHVFYGHGQGLLRNAMLDVSCVKTVTGDEFTALGTSVEIIKNKVVLHELVLYASRPVLKLSCNTVFCITFSATLFIWHYCINCYVRFSTYMTLLNVRIRIRNGERLGCMSKTLNKNW